MKKIINVSIGLYGIHTVKFTRYEPIQGYFQHNVYSNMTYYSYARLLRVMSKRKYYGLLTTKG